VELVRHRSEAEERGAASFFAEPRADPAQLRVCRGTACFLAGAAPEPGERGVHCLGYCDRGPARLDATGRARGPDSAELDPQPAIRALGPAPVTGRVARGDCSGLEAARAAGVWQTLEQALARPAGEVLDAMIASGERGRGGAGFPTGRKWQACAAAAGPKVVIANGDEGDPGSFVDRVLLELDSHAVLEGLALCAFAVGAEEGIVYVRGEYPRAAERMERAVSQARRAGWLGSSSEQSGFRFDVQVCRGRGSYVCGEETALLNSLEGRRGEVRLRPPYPTESGLEGLPTVVNNVETLVNVPWIVSQGAEAYAGLGTRASSGTKALCLAHGFARPGILEVPFGTSLRQVVEGHGGGGRDGRAIRALCLGGPMGSVAPPGTWDVPICYAALREHGLELGHGGIVPVLEGDDPRALLHHWLGFFADESCGKCAPCGLGSRRVLALLEAGAPRRDVEALLEVISATSLCAFGQRLPTTLQELLNRFGDEIFGASA
jgi:NADH:ubiquinone oxidoreductase subunit F (NADH-binding)